MGFGSRTVWELLDYLYQNYANILPANLTNNTGKMNEPWEPNQPVGFVIRQVQDTMDFAAHNMAPFTDEKVVN